jgi:solute carrier family 25 oxoglutarate transporter 11
MYPVHARRNYKNFLDGLVKVAEEGSLFRGALANGLKLALLGSTMTSLYDLCKENSYFFLGPSPINRLWSCLIATLVGTLVSMPFDMIRVRLHTMRPLPNGMYPYVGTFDCLNKILKYECNMHKSSNFQSFYAGLEAYLLRMFLICYLSMYCLDYYHAQKFVSEYWQPARFHY